MKQRDLLNRSLLQVPGILRSQGTHAQWCPQLWQAKTAIQQCQHRQGEIKTPQVPTNATHCAVV